MASQKPFFITGANALIKVDSVTVAYATNISCQVVVNHVSPRVLGRAEVEAHQPVSYDVAGSLSVVKYGKNVKSYFKDAAPNIAQDRGSGAGGFTQDSGVGSFVKKNLGIPKLTGETTGAAEEAFNPSRFFQSQQFDIEIFQKVGGSSDGSGGELTPMFVFRGCRFTGLQFQLEKKSPIILSMTFKARYYDDDTLVARGSGAGRSLVDG